jgi:O-antigen ligase
VLDLLMTIAMVYPVVPERIGNIQILPRSQGLRLVVLAVFAFTAAGVAKEMVAFVTRAGFISEEAQAKNEAQSKAGNLLLGGRPEFVIGLRAALDSPIIGHGSWARDIKYFEMLYDWTVETGAQQEQTGGDVEEEADGLIPGHSHIITAWVWAGIGGLIFWLYIVSLVGRGMAQVALLRPKLAPLYMWFLISMFWDIFISPFAANRRITEAVLIVLIVDLLKKKVKVPESSWRRMGALGWKRSGTSFNGPIAPAGLQ